MAHSPIPRKQLREDKTLQLVKLEGLRLEILGNPTSVVHEVADVNGAKGNHPHYSLISGYAISSVYNHEVPRNEHVAWRDLSQAYLDHLHIDVVLPEEGSSKFSRMATQASTALYYLYKPPVTEPITLGVVYMLVGNYVNFRDKSGIITP